jgi:hypothetical protein
VSVDAVRMQSYKTKSGEAESRCHLAASSMLSIAVRPHHRKRKRKRKRHTKEI